MTGKLISTQSLRFPCREHLFSGKLTRLSFPCLLSFSFVQESPRWLIQAGRIDDARRVLKKIMAVDGDHSEHSWSELEEMLANEQKKQEERTKKRKNYDFRHLFWNKYMASVTMIMWLGMFSTSFTNYGFVFNIEKLSGSLYINALLMGSLRWVLNIVFGLADLKFKNLGRKQIHLISKLTISACVFSIFITYYFGLLHSPFQPTMIFQTTTKTTRWSSESPPCSLPPPPPKSSSPNPWSSWSSIRLSSVILQFPSSPAPAESERFSGPSCSF